MRKYLYDYIKEIEKSPKKADIREMEIKISFFQHERLIHLIVTLFYALLFLIFLVLITLSYVFIIPAALLIIFLILYLIHYFILENGVQYLYKLRDDALKQSKK